MEISALSRKVNAADLQLDKLAKSTQVPQTEKVAEVSRQFEALLLRQILSQAQKPLFNSGLAGGSSGTTSAIYQDMVTQQLAERISEGGTFGFAKVLEKQLVFPGGQDTAEEPAVDLGKLL
jgi:Rod binding domain-containing protein